MGNPRSLVASQSNRLPRPLRHEQKFSRAQERRARSESVTEAGPEKNGRAKKPGPPSHLPGAPGATDVGAKIHSGKTCNEPPGLIQESEITVLDAYSANFRSNGQFWFASCWLILDGHFWRRWNAGCIRHSGSCIRLNKFCSCFRLRRRWSLICRNGVCARCSRIRQTPFSFCVLRPHNPGTNQRNILDHQPSRKKRKETNA